MGLQAHHIPVKELPVKMKIETTGISVKLRANLRAADGAILAVVGYPSRLDREDVRRANLIEDVAAQAGVKLRRVGRELVASCPFHAESSPSFSINSEKQTWICRGACAEGGDVFRFVERFAEVDFPGALVALAQRAGIGPGGPCVPLRRVVQPRSTPTPLRLPVGQVRRLWEASAGATACSEVAGWLRSRGLDAERVEDSDLCRSLPLVDLPKWAQRWRHGWRGLFPMYDAGGELIAVRARWTGAGSAPDGRKSLNPIGSSPAGLVLADPGGIAMLKGKVPPRSLWITEGEPDFMSTATAFGDAADMGILGIVSGSWTQEIAACVPTGIEVTIATHDDECGNRFASEIVTTLAGRVSLYRWRGAS